MLSSAIGLFKNLLQIDCEIFYKASLVLNVMNKLSTNITSTKEARMAWSVAHQLADPVIIIQTPARDIIFSDQKRNNSLGGAKWVSGIWLVLLTLNLCYCLQWLMLGLVHFLFFGLDVREGGIFRYEIRSQVKILGYCKLRDFSIMVLQIRISNKLWLRVVGINFC